MAKSTTPPPPKSGGTGYITAGILMLFAMGGLILWKVSHDKPPPEPPQEPAKPAKKAPILDEPPPPPPPPEIKDAEAEEEKPKQVKKVVGSGGCTGPCNGTVTANLGSALRAKGGQARGCYNRALRLNPTLKGRVMVAVTIGAQGQVCSANVTENALGDASVASCVTQRFRSGTFPPPKGGCVNTQVPLNFVPKP
jgi:outer membrane biosynthesis protein TonB